MKPDPRPPSWPASPASVRRPTTPPISATTPSTSPRRGRPASGCWSYRFGYWRRGRPLAADGSGAGFSPTCRGCWGSVVGRRGGSVWSRWGCPDDAAAADRGLGPGAARCRPLRQDGQAAGQQQHAAGQGRQARPPSTAAATTPTSTRMASASAPSSMKQGRPVRRKRCGEPSSDDRLPGWRAEAIVPPPGEAAATTARMPSSERSAPGQCAPSPSPVQNTPERGEEAGPDGEFSACFSGTRDSGLCTTMPMMSTSRQAAAAPRLA